LLPLRFPRLWSGLGWLLVAAVCVGSLIPGPALSGAGVDDKVMHAAAYCSLMVWFAGLYRRGLYPTIAVVLMALGVGLDLLQLLTATRSFDWYDVAMNCAGIAAGIVLSLLLLGGWCQRVERRLLS
jgi:VanZ family protein